MLVLGSRRFIFLLCLPPQRLPSPSIPRVCFHWVFSICQPQPSRISFTVPCSTLRTIHALLRLLGKDWLLICSLYAWPVLGHSMGRGMLTQGLWHMNCNISIFILHEQSGPRCVQFQDESERCSDSSWEISWIKEKFIYLFIHMFIPSFCWAKL